MALSSGALLALPFGAFSVTMPHSMGVAGKDESMLHENLARAGQVPS